MEAYEVEVGQLYGLVGTRRPFRRFPDIKELFRPVKDAISEFEQWLPWWTDDDGISPEYVACVEHRADEAFRAMRALIENLYSLILGAFRAAIKFARLLATAVPQLGVKPTKAPQDDRPPPGRLLASTPASPNAPPVPPVHVFWEALAA